MKINQARLDWQSVPRAGSEFRFPFGLSVFFPAYNDAPSLPALLARAFATLRGVADDYEVIVVNDGSTDETAEVLEQLRREYHPFLRIITHDRNRGYGAALRSGFAAAAKEFVFYTDGDGQYDPAELELLLRAVTPDTGLVNGYKRERNDPWHRVVIGWLYNHFARWLFRIRLRDIDCDFRLIRRSVLDLSRLRSTGGTICVELVRAVELSGADVTEQPVHHYPRRHGRSQFFRARSLAITFLQLGEVFRRLVVVPALRGGSGPNSGRTVRSDEAPPPADLSFSFRTAALVLVCVTALSFLSYGWALQLPFIADDYVQIQLARDFGPVSGWQALAHDALYRCRATSLVLTHWTERAFGLDPFAYNLSSLLLHIVNSLLVFALGCWRSIGWKVSTLAACFFAVGQRHSEAVVWYAAVPELLVFFFSLASFLCWVHWLQSRTPSVMAYAGTVFFYVLALLSKESAVAVAPLAVLAVFCHEERPLKRLWGAVPLVALAAGYFALAFVARKTHLHFSDGTFSLKAPFMEVLTRSIGGLLWVWGAVFLLALGIWRAWQWRSLLWTSAAWIILTLLPYSFLTYMPRVPSRHTYFASVGLSLIVAAGGLALKEWAELHKRKWMVPVSAAVIIFHESGYLWTVRSLQYAAREEPTVELLRIGRRSSGPIYAKCFPYSPFIAEYALKQ